ncbi:LysR family transcriptional regulator [Paraferrimonas sp. SM1919]|uniref:LysR family transcriptional regulator n=1 Tax=Paraferrimonas sp. SM1919 TaxID=2662263 RepID=UPI0013D87351|nr:LysR family transcriptional regulator [Paraferrimonas sp. SM1919]
MKTEDIILFQRIMESGSLVEAAKLTGQSKSTLSRRISQLEDDIGTKLFHRHNRQFQATRSGLHFYEASLDIINQLESTLTAINKGQQQLSGQVRVLLFPGPDLMMILDSIFKFMDKHPNVNIELMQSTGTYDLIKHQIDLAFMVQDTFNGQEVVARPLVNHPLLFTASPVYLSQHGTPSQLSQLQQHKFILYRWPGNPVIHDLPLKDGNSLSVTGTLCVNSVHLATSAAVQGRGIAYLPETFCTPYIARGELVHLFKDVEPFIGTGYLVYPSRRFIAPAAKALIDHLYHELL